MKENKNNMHLLKLKNQLLAKKLEDLKLKEKINVEKEDKIF